MGEIRWHILKKNEKSSIPLRYIFYDTESYPYPNPENPTEHRFKLGYCIHVTLAYSRCQGSQKGFFFYLKDKFFDYLESVSYKKTNTLVFAHNQNFDFQLVDGFNQMVNRGWKVKKWIIDSSKFILVYEKEDRKLTFLDSMNYTRYSLKTIGEYVNLPKYPRPKWNDSRELWEIYCKRDTEILKEFMMKYIEFIKVNDLGKFCYTIASQSFTAYRHRFMKKPIYIHKHKDIMDMERKAYRGGRTEAFFIGQCPGFKFYALDINSMYPYVMRKFQYPVKLIDIAENISVNELRSILKNKMVIADVEIDISEPAIAYKDKRLIFPVGRFRVCLTTPELFWVLVNGKITRVHKVAVYRGEYIFREFIDSMFSLKAMYEREGNTIFREITKLIMNSLYGKFGQKNPVWEKLPDSPDSQVGSEIVYDFDTGERHQYKYLYHQSWRKNGEEPASDTFFAIPSHVTAYARLHLWNMIVTAGRDNVFYVDTDSLFVNGEGKERVSEWIKENELGMLKVVTSAPTLLIRGAKDYVFGDIEKIKGIRKEDKKVSANEYEGWRFRKVLTAWNKNTFGKMIIDYVSKILKRNYEKGKVRKSGRVDPFRLS